MVQTLSFVELGEKILLRLLGRCITFCLLKNLKGIWYSGLTKVPICIFKMPCLYVTLQPIMQDILGAQLQKNQELYVADTFCLKYLILVISNTLWQCTNLPVLEILLQN